MKILSTIRLIAVVMSLSVITLGVSSCKKDDDVSMTDDVQLLSFGPAGVKHGEKISIIGNNLDRVTAVEFTGATVESGAFEQHTSELIVLTVPMSAERGVITLKTSEGDVVSKSPFDLEVPVVITDFPAVVRPGENMTIKGNFLNWVTAIQFPQDTLVTTFVSQSLTELVVSVPMTAETGPLIFFTGGTEPLSIPTETEVVVTLPAITGLSPVSVEKESDLTIMGTDLDLAEGVIFPGVTDPVMTFVSRTPNQIVVKVPKEARKGKISLRAWSGVTVESESAIEIAGDLPPLEPMSFLLYDDALKNGWSKWDGWGTGSLDLASTEKVRDGEKSIKVTFGGGWGAPLQIGGEAVTAGRTEFRLSVFGMPGTNGKKLVVNIKGGSKERHELSVVEGEWTEYKWLIATELGAPATIKEFSLQDDNWAGTIFIDQIGLK